MPGAFRAPGFLPQEQDLWPTEQGQIWPARAGCFFGQLGQRGQPLHRPDIPYEVDAWTGRGQRGHGYVDEL